MWSWEVQQAYVLQQLRRSHWRWLIGVTLCRALNNKHCLICARAVYGTDSAYVRYWKCFHDAEVCFTSILVSVLHFSVSFPINAKKKRKKVVSLCCLLLQPKHDRETVQPITAPAVIKQPIKKRVKNTFSCHSHPPIGQQPTLDFTYADKMHPVRQWMDHLKIVYSNTKLNQKCIWCWKNAIFTHNFATCVTSELVVHVICQTKPNPG